MGTQMHTLGPSSRAMGVCGVLCGPGIMMNQMEQRRKIQMGDGVSWGYREISGNEHDLGVS